MLGYTFKNISALDHKCSRIMIVCSLVTSAIVGNVWCNCRCNQAYGFYYSFGTIGCQILCANQNASHRKVLSILATTVLQQSGCFSFVNIVFQNLVVTWRIMSCTLQIPISCLTEFLSALERGYSKHTNPYHSHVHAADVTQTLHCLLLRSGLVVHQAHCNTRDSIAASHF